MKHSLVIVFVFSGILNSFSQCPSNTTVDGHEFPVVQIKSQCFYLDNSGYFLGTGLNSILGLELEFDDSPPVTDISMTVTSGSVTNYVYNYSYPDCNPHENVTVGLAINFDGDAKLFGLPVDCGGSLIGTVTVERSYSATLIENGGATTTQLQLTSTTLLNSHFDLDLNNSLLNSVASVLESDLAEIFVLPTIVPIISAQANAIHKLNDNTVPMNVQLSGPSIICDGPIVLSATAGQVSYLWSDGSTNNSLTVDEAGTYSVTVGDNFCNSTILSKEVTKGAKGDDFIKAEVLCNGKVKLSAEGFASVTWSTGESTPSIEVAASGNYTAGATGEDGCSGSDKINLIISPSCAPGNGSVAPLSVVALCSDVPNLLRRWKITNPNSTAVRMDWEIVGTIQKTWVDVPPGDSFLSSIAVPLNQNVLKVYWHDAKGQIKSLQLASNSSRCKSSSTAATSSFGRLGAELKVFPNPAKDQFVIEIPSDDERVIPIQILSSSGVVWYSGKVQLSQGQNFLSNDISTFDNGSYIIKIGGETIRFMKE